MVRAWRAAKKKRTSKRRKFHVCRSRKSPARSWTAIRLPEENKALIEALMV